MAKKMSKREAAEKALEARLLAKGWQKGPDGKFDPDLGKKQPEAK